MTEFNKNLIDNIEVEGIDHRDYPEYVDAFISSADYDGVEMTDEQLDELNEDYELVSELVWEYLF
jgi:hypothetical protein|tara:strand:+ start:260 stop:454 length:195 start_codon:yes stop_codon:yes gene_type:complete